MSLETGHVTGGLNIDTAISACRSSRVEALPMNPNILEI